MVRLRLAKHLERAVLLGHPWIYRDRLPKDFRLARPAWVELTMSKLSAYALWDPDSSLALRVYSREQKPDPELFSARVATAWTLREPLRATGDTDAFRWINGEGDELPGVVADFYAGYAVIVLASPCCELFLPWLVDALCDATPLRGIILRRSDRTHRSRSADAELLFGEWPPTGLVVREYGVKLEVDLRAGQKTGLFLDQRDNRQLIEQHCGERQVLNLFAYTGAFSLVALRGGATHVTTLDASEPAIAAAKRNFLLNAFDPDAHAFETSDAFEFLERCRQEKRLFDVVICDPPSFGSQQAKLDRALSAYTRLYAAGLKVTAPGGLFAASSCTARVTPSLLAGVLAHGAQKARRQVQIIADTGHAPDHPICAGHPEGRYLKFLLGRVSPRS